MKLVESDAEGPQIEESITTPPKPEKRRVSISLLFTLGVLIGTVVTIYGLLPARHNLLMTEAIAAHQQDSASFDLVSPSQGELRAWMIGAVGRDAPVVQLAGVEPAAATVVSIHRRNAAVVRYRLGTEVVTVLVQHAKGWSPSRASRDSGSVHAEMRLAGQWTVVVVADKNSTGAGLVLAQLAK
jgi:hypothetical protein